MKSRRYLVAPFLSVLIVLALLGCIPGGGKQSAISTETATSLARQTLAAEANATASFQTAVAEAVGMTAAAQPKPDVTQLVGETPRPDTPSPTYTPPPTYTPVPSPTHTPTPTPTPGPTRLPVELCKPVGDRFGGIWSAIQKRVAENDTLGCPLNDAHPAQGAAEQFKNGYMMWRSDNKQIYVLYTNGHAGSFRDEFQAGSDPEKAGYTAPSGFVEPRSGFGKVWREQLGGPSSEIGWAMGDQYVAPNLVVQDFENGVIFWEDFVGNRVFLLSSGRWEQW